MMGMAVDVDVDVDVEVAVAVAVAVEVVIAVDVAVDVRPAVDDPHPRRTKHITPTILLTTIPVSYHTHIDLTATLSRPNERRPQARVG
jgi:hypothetical protein